MQKSKVFLVTFAIAAISLALFFGLFFGPQCDTASDDGVIDITSPPLYEEYDSAAVASDAGPCSTIGKSFLKEGGSVVDAAIGTMLCVGLHNAHRYVLLHNDKSRIGLLRNRNCYETITVKTAIAFTRQVPSNCEKK